MSDGPRSDDENLTEGSLARHLVRLTGPMTIGLIAIMSIGVADAYFIGQIGKLELAAISFIFPVTTALKSLGIGLSAGANALISQSLGADARDRAQRFAAHAITLTVASGVIIALLGWIGWEPLFAMLQAQPDVRTAIGDYMRIWFITFPLLTLLLVANSAIRAYGNTVWPSSVMVLNAIFNIGLDPLFIFGWGPVPALGIAGAAYATLVAYIIASAVMLVPLFGAIRVTTPACFIAPGYGESIRKLAHIGGPAALANALNPAGLSIVTAIVARFGPAAVAGFGAAGRIQSFALVPLLALSGSIGPLVGQNFGAGAERRAGRAVSLASLFCAAYGLALAFAMLWAADPLAAQFSDDSEVRASAAAYLRIASWSFLGYGILIVVNASLNARSKPLVSMGLSAGRIGLGYIPLALAGAHWLGETGVYWGAFAANLLAAAAAVVIAGHYRILAAPAR